MSCWKTMVAVLFIAGCSATASDLDTSKNAERVSEEFDLNYQEVYARIRRESLECYAKNMSISDTAEINAELFSELGYGEVVYRISSGWLNNYYWSVRVEKVSATHSKLSIISANTVNNHVAVSKILAWANGKTGCDADKK